MTNTKKQSLNKTEKSKFKEFQSIDKEIHLLGGISALLGWDKQTLMPLKADHDRAEESSYLSEKIHALMTSEKLYSLIQDLTKTNTLNKFNKREQTLLKYYKKEIEKSRKIPIKFVQEYSKLTSKSYNEWVEARKAKNYKQFQSTLNKIILMKKKEANFISKKKPIYNTILDEFEEGMIIETIDPVFEELRNGIIYILKKIKQSKKYKNQKDKLAKLKFSKDTQISLCQDIVELMLQEKDRYVVAESVHPFTTRLSFDDTRITVAVRDKQPLFSFTSAAHEAGHALYEMGMDKKLKDTALRDSPSFGLHESQSRIWENQIMRGKLFWQFFYPKFKKAFPSLKDVKLEEFFFLMNQVKPSLIRIECDELTYCLHVIIRYELEKQIFSGKIKTIDLETKWNEKYHEYLGVTPRHAAEGILQDVHWAEGYFGYFPTYAIGTLYSAMLYERMEKDIPEFEKKLVAGNIASVRNWLRENVHKFGREMTAEEIVFKATGKHLTAKPFLDYLKDKYFKLYEINE